MSTFVESIEQDAEDSVKDLLVNVSHDISEVSGEVALRDAAIGAIKSAIVEFKAEAEKQLNKLQKEQVEKDSSFTAICFPTGICWVIILDVWFQMMC